MILGSHINPIFKDIFYWVIGPTMTKLHLFGLGPVSKSEKLMPHTDTKERIVLLNLSNGSRDLITHTFRVPWPIREDNSLGSIFFNDFKTTIPRKNDNIRVF